MKLSLQNCITAAVGGLAVLGLPVYMMGARSAATADLEEARAATVARVAAVPAASPTPGADGYEWFRRADSLITGGATHAGAAFHDPGPALDELLEELRAGPHTMGPVAGTEFVSQVASGLRDPSSLTEVLRGRVLAAIESSPAEVLPALRDLLHWDLLLLTGSSPEVVSAATSLVQPKSAWETHGISWSLDDLGTRAERREVGLLLHRMDCLEAYRRAHRERARVAAENFESAVAAHEIHGWIARLIGSDKADLAAGHRRITGVLDLVEIEDARPFEAAALALDGPLTGIWSGHPSQRELTLMRAADPIGIHANLITSARVQRDYLIIALGGPFLGPTGLPIEGR